MVLSTRRTREPRRSCVAQATALCAGPLFALHLSACTIFKRLLAAAGIKPQAMAMHTLLIPPNEVSHRRVRCWRVLAQMWASPGAISAGVPRCTRTRHPRRGSRSGSRAAQRCRPVLSTSDRCKHCGALLTDFGAHPRYRWHQRSVGAAVAISCTYAMISIWAVISNRPGEIGCLSPA